MRMLVKIQHSRPHNFPCLMSNKDLEDYALANLEYSETTTKCGVRAGRGSRVTSRRLGSAGVLPAGRELE